MFGFCSPFIHLSGAIRLPKCAGDRHGRQAPDVDEGQSARQKSGWGSTPIHPSQHADCFKAVLTDCPRCLLTCSLSVSEEQRIPSLTFRPRCSGREPLKSPTKRIPPPFDSPRGCVETFKRRQLGIPAQVRQAAFYQT